MTNEVNLGKWLEELRTTDIPQVTGTLVRLKDYGEFSTAPSPATPENVLGMCCLGIGEYLMTGQLEPMVRRTLPKYSFADWLDVRDDGDSSDGDNIGTALYIEWPTQLLERGQYDESGARRDDYVWIEVSELNDHYKLTFPQIADVIEYFGLAENE